MRIRSFMIAVVCLFIFAGLAASAPVVDEKKPALGAHFMYSFIPDSFLSMAYQEHTSISALGYGVWASYGFTQFDALFQVNNWTLMMDDGAWRANGDKKKYRYWMENDNFGMADFTTSILWKWRVHPAVEPYVGPSMGVGFLYGHLKSWDSNDAGKQIGEPTNKELPPVLPLVGFLGGCRFYPVPNFRISADLGFYAGFAGGVSLGYAF
ncbi:MAG: hypothetical protein GX444_21245 [Myxococcales bacterium]|nr:hypothetical protein [Myxococcales bacterium]